MNKNVLRTMIILCWVFLALYAVLKLVPQLASKFVIVVNNEKIVKVGQFVDEREWLGDIIYFLTTLLTYQFYLCACCHKWFLSIKQYLVSLAIIVPIDKSDFYAIANMVYSDYYNPRFDTNTYVQLAIDWLDDKDVGGNKTLKYYMKVVK